MGFFRALLRHWLFWTVTLSLTVAAVVYRKPLREFREADGCREGGGVWDRKVHTCRGAPTALKFGCETSGGAWEAGQCTGAKDPAFADCWNLNKIWIAETAQCIDRAALKAAR